MNVATTVPILTTEQLLAMPDDGMERWLIRGQLREKPMTYRNRWHGRVEARIAHLLLEWLDQQPDPRGMVLSGEIGCRLRRDPDSIVGIDVVYISAALAAQEPQDTTLVDGVPILAVEVLSPSTKQEEIDEKVAEYRSAGVALMWVVNPRVQTVTVYRPDAKPQLFNVDQELTAEPHLPGFRTPVARIFGR